MRDVLCTVEDIPDGGSKGVLPDHRGRDRGFLVRQGQQIFAYVNNCPHYDRAPLGWKKDEFLNGARTRIMCAAHGALFTIEQGSCVVGPCLGQSLTSIDIKVENGLVLKDEEAAVPLHIDALQTPGTRDVRSCENKQVKKP